MPDRPSKKRLVQRPVSIGLAMAAMAVPTCFAWDKATDASLQFAHSRNIETARKRLQTVLNIKGHFPTTGAETGIASISNVPAESKIGDPEFESIIEATGFPREAGIAEVVQQPLPQIVGDTQAQAALEACEQIHSACVDKVRLEECLQPYHPSSSMDAVGHYFADKFRYDTIRDCSIDLHGCESDLVKCVQDDVIAQCKGSMAME
jgi:hypothetical protein